MRRGRPRCNGRRCSPGRSGARQGAAASAIAAPLPPDAREHMSSTAPIADRPARSDASPTLARCARARPDRRRHPRPADAARRGGRRRWRGWPASGKVAFRPGREAEIIRRLLARHAGALPRRVLPRLWRELFAATTAMQGSLVIAVCETEPAAGFVGLRARAFRRADAAARASQPGPRDRRGQRRRRHRRRAAAAAGGGAGRRRLVDHAAAPRRAAHPRGRPPAVLGAAGGGRAAGAGAGGRRRRRPTPSSRDRTLLGFELPPEMSRARLSGRLRRRRPAARGA